MKTSSTKVFFRYEKDQNGKKVENGKIEAIAIKLEDNSEIARREVKLRHGDKADRRTGRTYAFKKVVNFMRAENLISSKERKELWKQFNSTCKQPSNKLAY